MENIEIWKSLDFLGYPNYKVSNFGRVKSLNYKCSGKEKILKLVKNKLGYIQITLSKEGERKNFQVHKLVALAFLKNTYNLPMINHKDENPLNNHVDNLEWCTAKHNANYGTRNERVSKTSKTKKINCKSILQYTLDGNFIRVGKYQTSESGIKYK